MAEPLPLFDFQPSRYVWRYLDRETAAQVWAELIDWVAWLRATYGNLHHDIPPCWFRHPELREELLALMAAHKAAYQTREEDRYWSDMAYWHRQYLRPVMTQLRSMFDSSECRDGHCGYQPPRVQTLDTLSEYVGADLTARPAAQVAVSRPRQSETMTYAQIQAARKQGHEVAACDPDDPFSDIEIDGRLWYFDKDTDSYSPHDGT
ncbi:hypothetical protein [Gordonia sp. N1V]|uniref:hypothetical protein n=1 Tax=Gordonia sp. N1V TaxID=3034163 RepID=UPI0023E322F6|nr:hypothetical protein [Gordonia sp. N1V]MDF3285022.1 hypothetical protein [Gordonia sp. N1V]